MKVMRTPTGKLRRRAAIGAVGLAALGGGGAALAAARSDSPAAQNQAIATDAAGQLGVSASDLTAAIKKAMVDQIEAKNAAARSLQQLHRDLPNQSEADHRNQIAQLHFRRANTVQRNRAQSCKCSLLECNVVRGRLSGRNARHQ